MEVELDPDSEAANKVTMIQSEDKTETDNNDNPPEVTESPVTPTPMEDVQAEPSGQTEDTSSGHDNETSSATRNDYSESNDTPGKIKMETNVILSEAICHNGTGAKAGDVVLRYNCQDSSCFKRKEKETGVKWIVNKNPLNGDVLTTDTKFMFQSTRDVANGMDSVASDLSAAISQSHGLGAAADLRESSTENFYVGRIRSSSGKLSADSVLLEGTLEASGGHVISLDLSHAQDYHIFPGQVLGVRGMNSGRCVHVSQVFIPPPLPLPEGRISINTATGPLSVVVAAGPFTPKNSLAFEPFTDLINVLDETRPDVCFLLGPFLDSSHRMTDKMQETFEKNFNKRLSDLSTVVGGFEVPTQILLVSSWREAHHHPAFPTVPYLTKEFPNLISVPDPATVSIGGIVFSLTTADVLMHLSRNELANSRSTSDRMGRLASHLLIHRSFYPLYPPDESVPFDGELWIEYGQLRATPHVLILPSDLKHFIKDVLGTLVVNPERLSKGNQGGTFARLLIDLPNDPDDLTGVGDGSPITGFVSGEIIKI